MKALAKLVRRVCYYYAVAFDLGTAPSTIKTMVVRSDSESLVKAVKRGYLANDKVHMRTDFSQILRAVRHALIVLMHMPGADNPADLFTKSLSAVVHAKHTDFALNDATFPRHAQV